MLWSIYEFHEDQCIEGWTFHRGVYEIMLRLVQWYCIIFWCKEHLANICWLYHRVHSLWLCYIMPVTKPCFIQPSAKWGEAPPGTQVITACEVFGPVWHLGSPDGWIINAGVTMIAVRKSCCITASTTTNNWLCHRNCCFFVLLICVFTFTQYVTLMYCKCKWNILFKWSSQIQMFSFLITPRMSFCGLCMVFVLMRYCSDIWLFVLKWGLVSHLRWPLCMVSHWWKPWNCCEW